MRGYLSLCYHYIRPSKNQDPYPKLLGITESEFRDHLKMLKERYHFLSLEEVDNYSSSSFDPETSRLGMHITFDDGLADHLIAARILAEENIRGTFFIPTCIFEDKTPANPIIIHYALAIYRIEGFIKAYREALIRLGLDIKKNNILWSGKKDDAWKTIKLIKEKFKYDFPYKTGRGILLDIYKNLLKKNDPEILKKMHLTSDAVREIITLGHSIGAHSRSHISVAATKLSASEFEKEINEPQEFLAKTFKIPVISMSYPFGEKKRLPPNKRPY
ncbi:MAG: polysaccharide deacetylase family protein [Candidatus Paceibacterota bacterium]|jgi:peptidoglycan/xylan/chitin deacetylase (PgdA/CDA1 family)